MSFYIGLYKENVVELGFDKSIKSARYELIFYFIFFFPLFIFHSESRNARELLTWNTRETCMYIYIRMCTLTSQNIENCRNIFALRLNATNMFRLYIACTILQIRLGKNPIDELNKPPVLLLILFSANCFFLCWNSFQLLQIWMFFYFF